MDALSDLLRVVRLSGGVFLDAEFTAPWCIASQIGPEDCRMVLAEPQAIVAFHYVVAGRLLLQTPGEAPVEVESGAIVLLPRNDPHTLASEPGLPAVSSHDLIQANGDIARIRYGGGGETTRIVCGFVGTEARQNPLLDALPPTLILDLNGKPAGGWVASSFRYAAAELSAVRAGSAIALAKLSELLFVEAARHYIEMLPDERRGWLAGLRDPAVGRALALLHTQLARPWTAETLAREVFLSRSTFAERFTALIGVPPMKYLASWRMQVAAQRLREGHRSVAQIAADVGYESEAAFTRAFKRAFSISPARWRKQPLAA
ncbi:MAG TPA: AraC family transcriptional regulator [Burkholderiales bacterium]|nr:AraC family transcriptional regulator [Burkholderiales bacterium]